MLGNGPPKEYTEVLHVVSLNGNQSLIGCILLRKWSQSRVCIMGRCPHLTSFIRKVL